MIASAPVDPAKRIEPIDVLRGLALFGVLAINVVGEFRVSIFAQFLPAPSAPPLDRAVEAFLSVAVQMKAFVLFSLLFGAGLAIQLDRFAGQPRRTQLLLRRLAVLLAIGLVHLFLIWNGDILTEYALAGFVALPFLFGPTWLLATGALAFLALYLAMPWVSPIAALPDAQWLTQHVAAATRIYRDAGFLDILALRIGEVPAIAPLHLYVFPRTVAMFLLGALAWRAGVLRDLPAYRRPLRRAMIVAIAVGSALTLVALDPAALALPAVGDRARFTIDALAAIALAIGYGAGILALASLPIGARMLRWAAALGRMAFTNYLAQSVILGFVFYGYGLGLFGRLGAAAALMIAIGLYAAQAMFSSWWLRRFRYGPVEWLWRSLMYGVAQPIRRVH